MKANASVQFDAGGHLRPWWVEAREQLRSRLRSQKGSPPLFRRLRVKLYGSHVGANLVHNGGAASAERCDTGAKTSQPRVENWSALAIETYRLRKNIVKLVSSHPPGGNSKRRFGDFSQKSRNLPEVHGGVKHEVLRRREAAHVLERRGSVFGAEHVGGARVFTCRNTTTYRRPKSLNRGIGRGGGVAGLKSAGNVGRQKSSGLAGLWVVCTWA